MTASHDKTLFDKTIARRVQASGRRTRRGVAAAVSLGVVAVFGASTLAPAHAQVKAADLGGFTTLATAAPLKIEIFEPVIPIPTEPQLEFDVSYTKVTGESGPSTTARASAFWPGSGLGEGAKTFGDQLGIPAALTAGGYPAQVNAAYPGDNTDQRQEPAPGMFSRATAGGKQTVAIAGYSNATPTDGDAGDGEGSPGGLDLGNLGGLLTGGADASNPLGAFATLVNFNGVTSVSSTTYTAKEATATATSKVGEISMLLGLIKLSGVNVVTKTTATIDGGVKTSQVVDVGGINIAGQKFTFGPNGLTAAGTSTPVPTSAIGSLVSSAGISFDVPKPVVTTDGLSSTTEAQALTVTLDLGKLKAAVPSLSPLLQPIVGLIPDTGTQADLLKGVLGSLSSVAPKLVLRMGQASTAVTVVPPFDAETGGETSTPTSGDAPATGTPAGGDPAAAGTGAGGSAGEIPPAASGGEDPITSDQIDPMAAIPGLPPLGSIPMWLILGGLLLGAGVGWYLRNAGFILFGGRGAGLCHYGLKAGIPDLRKA